jgi:peptidoglycan/LPS O-acetylase OafA/YrhL
MNFNRIGAIGWYRSFQASRFFWIVALSLVLAGDGVYLVSPATFYIVGQSIASVGTALCIDWCIRNSGTKAGHLLNWRPVVYVGTLSYSLYLWQNVFFNHDWLAWPASFPINLVFASGMAMLSYYLVEKPFLRLRKSAAPRRAMTSAPLTTAD